jgi:hypothetical protein
LTTEEWETAAANVVIAAAIVSHCNCGTGAGFIEKRKLLNEVSTLM